MSMSCCTLAFSHNGGLRDRPLESDIALMVHMHNKHNFYFLKQMKTIVIMKYIFLLLPVCSL